MFYVKTYYFEIQILFKNFSLTQKSTNENLIDCIFYIALSYLNEFKYVVFIYYFINVMNKLINFKESAKIILQTDLILYTIGFSISYILYQQENDETTSDGVFSIFICIIIIPIQYFLKINSIRWIEKSINFKLSNLSDLEVLIYLIEQIKVNSFSKNQMLINKILQKSDNLVMIQNINLEIKDTKQQIVDLIVRTLKIKYQNSQNILINLLEMQIHLYMFPNMKICIQNLVKVYQNKQSLTFKQKNILVFLQYQFNKTLFNHSQHEGLNINKFIKYQKLLTNYHQKTIQSINIFSQFLITLQKSSENIDHIMNQLKSFSDSFHNIHNLYKKINQNYSLNYEIKQKFKNYMELTVAEPKQLMEFRKELSYMSKNYLKFQDLPTINLQSIYKFKLYFLVFSKNPQNYNQIIFLSSDIKDLLNYTIDELLQQKISIIFPQFRLNSIEKKITDPKYINTLSQKNNLNPEIFQTKENDLKYTITYISMYPDLLNGLFYIYKIWEVSQKSEGPSFIIFDQKLQQINGISKMLKKRIKSYKKIKIENIFPYFYSTEVQDKLKTNDLFDIKIDLKYIQTDLKIDKIKIKRLPLDQERFMVLNLTGIIQSQNNKKLGVKVQTNNSSILSGGSELSSENEPNQLIMVSIKKFFDYIQKKTIYIAWTLIIIFFGIFPIILYILKIYFLLQVQNVQENSKNGIIRISNHYQVAAIIYRFNFLYAYSKKPFYDNFFSKELISNFKNSKSRVIGTQMQRQNLFSERYIKDISGLTNRNIETLYKNIEFEKNKFDEYTILSQDLQKQDFSFLNYRLLDNMQIFHEQMYDLYDDEFYFNVINEIIVDNLYELNLTQKSTNQSYEDLIYKKFQFAIITNYISLIIDFVLLLILIIIELYMKFKLNSFFFILGVIKQEEFIQVRKSIEQSKFLNEKLPKNITRKRSIYDRVKKFEKKESLQINEQTSFQESNNLEKILNENSSKDSEFVDSDSQQENILNKNMNLQNLMKKEKQKIYKKFLFRIFLGLLFCLNIISTFLKLNYNNNFIIYTEYIIEYNNFFSNFSVFVILRYLKGVNLQLENAQLFQHLEERDLSTDLRIILEKTQKIDFLSDDFKLLISNYEKQFCSPALQKSYPQDCLDNNIPIAVFFTTLISKIREQNYIIKNEKLFQEIYQQITMSQSCLLDIRNQLSSDNESFFKSSYQQFYVIDFFDFFLVTIGMIIWGILLTYKFHLQKKLSYIVKLLFFKEIFQSNFEMLSQINAYINYLMKNKVVKKEDLEDQFIKLR